MPLWIHLYLRHAICEHKCAPRIAIVKHSRTTLAARPNQSEAHCSHGVPSGSCISSSLAASNSSRSSGMEMVLWLPMSMKPVLAAALLPPMSTARTAFANAPATEKWEDILHAGRHQGCSHKMYHNASATWRSSRQPAHDHGHSATCLLLLTGGLHGLQPASPSLQPASRQACWAASTQPGPGHAAEPISAQHGRKSHGHGLSLAGLGCFQKGNGLQ